MGFEFMLRPVYPLRVSVFCDFRELFRQKASRGTQRPRQDHSIVGGLFLLSSLIFGQHQHEQGKSFSWLLSDLKKLEAILSDRTQVLPPP